MKPVLLAASSLLAAAFAVAVTAQDLGASPGREAAVERTPLEASSAQAEEGLSFTVTDENAWADIGIAIPAFATDRERATPANAGGTGALGREVARVITANLKNNGLFKPGEPAAARLCRYHRACLWRMERSRGGDAGARLCPRAR
jgi:TolB protein